MKKIVFSSVCAVALSSSAFAAGTLDLTIKANTPWYEQLGGTFDESLLDKNWADGATAIGSILGKSDATLDNKTIVGSFLTATAKNGKDAANEKENGYYVGKYDADNKGGLQVVVAGLNATDKSKITTATAIKDYELVSDQMYLANAAAKIYNALDAKNVVKADIDGENSTKKMATDFVLADSDNRQALVEVLLEANKNKSDGSEKLSYYQKDDGKGGKILDDTKIEAGIKTLFAGGGDLNAYDGTILKEASNDAKKLASMQGKIIADINSLVASSKDSAEAKHIQEQLNDALAMFDRYAKANKQINEKGKKIQEAGEVVINKFTSATGYTDVAKDGDIFLTTRAEIQKNIGKVVEGKMAGIDETSTTIDKDYALAANSKLSIDQAIKWLDAKQADGVEYSAIDAGSKFESYDKLKEALNAIKKAVEDGKEAPVTSVDNIKEVFKETAAGDAINLDFITDYNKAVEALKGVKDEELKAIITAKTEFDALLAKLASNSITGELKTKEVNQALGVYKGSAKAQALVRLLVDKDGKARTEASVAAKAEVDFASLSAEDKEKLGKTEDEQKANYKKQEVAKFKAQIQTAANEVAKEIVESNKQSISAEALSTLNIQINNMNKRMGELRGLDGEAGAWIRTWGGKISGDDIDSFNYYSTQIGADKKSSLKDGDLYIGALIGMDKVDSEVKSTSYSAGLYASFISNSGFFADGVAKFISTSHDRSGYDIENQMSFLASFEGGYRFNATESFYVEPSLEFITGHIGEYSSKQASVTTKVDSFSPVVFKPQVFVGGEMDSFTYRAGVGGVLNANEQTASVRVADIVEGVNATGETKLDKNNHGFVSLGGSYKINNNLRLNLGLERSFGGKLTNDYEVNATVRYGF